MADVKLNQQVVQESPKVVTVSVAGEVDTINGPRVENYVDEVIQSVQPRHVLLDLSGLTFAGSPFYSSLLFWKEEQTKRGGMLVLFGLRQEIASWLRLLTLDRILTICADQKAALDALPKG